MSWATPPRNEHASIMCEMATGKPPVDKIWAADGSLSTSSSSASISPTRLREASRLTDLAPSEEMRILTIHNP